MRENAVGFVRGVLLGALIIVIVRHHTTRRCTASPPQKLCSPRGSSAGGPRSAACSRLRARSRMISLSVLTHSKIVKMKLAIASLLVGSAAAFAPAASFGVRNSALNMAETATETDKVRRPLSSWSAEHNRWLRPAPQRIFASGAYGSSPQHPPR